MGKQNLKTVDTHFLDLIQRIRQQLTDQRDNRGKVFRIDDGYTGDVDPLAILANKKRTMTILITAKLKGEFQCG